MNRHSRMGAGSQWAICPLLAVLFTARAFAQDDGVDQETDFPPKKFNPSRYEVIWKKNPFLSEVAVVGEPSEDVESWAKGFVLRSVTRVSAKYIVHVENTSPPKAKDPVKGAVRYHSLTEDTPSRHGLTIVRVKAHRDPSQVEVTVGKMIGDVMKEATIKYDLKALAARPASRRTTQQQARPTTRPAANPTTATPQTSAMGQRGRSSAGTTPAARSSQGAGNATQTQGGARTQGRSDSRGRRGRGSADASERPRVVLPPGTNR
ncbi:MAG: hypothetical protein L7V86_26215 [Verrucomicrobiales bacterium]|nr:hypothetical protein [Verrucomicrobiales bacterium]